MHGAHPLPRGLERELAHPRRRALGGFALDPALAGKHEERPFGRVAHAAPAPLLLLEAGVPAQSSGLQEPPEVRALLLG